jgi:hypothetical protein
MVVSPSLLPEHSCTVQIGPLPSTPRVWRSYLVTPRDSDQSEETLADMGRSDSLDYGSFADLGTVLDQSQSLVDGRTDLSAEVAAERVRMPRTILMQSNASHRRQALISTPLILQTWADVGLNTGCTTQEFLESFRRSCTLCNAHFVQERDKLTEEYEAVVS